MEQFFCQSDNQGSIIIFTRSWLFHNSLFFVTKPNSINFSNRYQSNWLDWNPIPSVLFPDIFFINEQKLIDFFWQIVEGCEKLKTIFTGSIVSLILKNTNSAHSFTTDLEILIKIGFQSKVQIFSIFREHFIC